MSGRRIARVAALALLVMVAWVVAPSGTAGAAAPATTPVTVLPFLGGGDVSGHGTGGPGTASRNAAVAAACNHGDTIVHPQWYHLSGVEYQYVVARVDAPFYPRGVDQNPSGVAVLNARTGAVITCRSTAVRTAFGKGLDVVAYYSQPVDACLDPSDPQFCADGSLRLSISAASRSTGPVNDHWQHATRISALPFTGKADTSFADADATDTTALVDYEHCLQSSIEPGQLATAWWKYTPATTGPAPTLRATADSAWSPDVAFRSQTAIMQPSGSGLVLAPRDSADPWDCEAPTILQAGHTYYFAVFTPTDRYYDSTLVAGGPLTLRVGGTTRPAAVRGLTAVSRPSSTQPFRASWSAPTGGPAVTSYGALVQRRSFGGSWRTVASTTLPASATSWTPTTASWIAHLQALRVTITPRSVAGAGPSTSLVVLPRS